MALLALEAEMHLSLAYFVKIWITSGDTEAGADVYSAMSSVCEATVDWVLSEFALTV